MSACSEKIWDPIRKKWVIKTKEESVRQELIQKMLFSLGFPKGSIAVEKQVPSLGLRRFDLVVFIPFNADLIPLLVVECKAENSRGAREQILGYNDSLQAPFLAIATEDQIETFWKEEGGWKSVPFLPSFKELKQWTSCATQGSSLF